MEASEIVRRNEAIARFMGWQRDGEDQPWYFVYNGMIRDQQYAWQHSPAFDTDWGLLMPAVDQITIQAGLSHHVLRDDFGDGVFYKCDFTPEHYGSYIHVLRGFGKTMIESIFVAVSDYCLSLEPSPGAGV